MQGDLMLVMAGDPYYGPAMGRVTLAARFGVQVSNVVGAAALLIEVQHRNSDETAWTVAGAFPLIAAAGPFSVVLTGLKEWVRYSYRFTAGASSDGMYVFTSTPQWMLD